VTRVYAVFDNLAAHMSQDVLLFNLAYPRWEFVFQPVAATYLNVVEPRWNVLLALALKGRRFDTCVQIADAVARATAYWNGRRHLFHWGRRRRHPPRRRGGEAAPPSVR
jgi:hypothetical protein